MDLIERLRKSRQSKVSAGPFKFTIRRPTDIEAQTMQFTSHKEAIMCVMGFVIGWKGVKESDLVDGGLDEPVPFTPELFQEWVQDRADLWEELINGVLAAYEKHAEDLASEGKR